jgi:uncharacterized C2H2 Zn-finger protein
MKNKTKAQSYGDGKCPICNKVYKYAGGLQRHLMKEHKWNMTESFNYAFEMDI